MSVSETKSIASAVDRNRSIRASSSNVLRKRLRGFQGTSTLPMSKTTIKRASLFEARTRQRGRRARLLGAREFSAGLDWRKAGRAAQSSGEHDLDLAQSR